MGFGGFSWDFFLHFEWELASGSDLYESKTAGRFFDAKTTIHCGWKLNEVLTVWSFFSIQKPTSVVAGIPSLMIESSQIN